MYQIPERCAICGGPVKRRGLGPSLETYNEAARGGSSVTCGTCLGLFLAVILGWIPMLIVLAIISDAVGFLKPLPYYFLFIVLFAPFVACCIALFARAIHAHGVRVVLAKCTYFLTYQLIALAPFLFIYSIRHKIIDAHDNFWDKYMNCIRPLFLHKAHFDQPSYISTFSTTCDVFGNSIVSVLVAIFLIIIILISLIRYYVKVVPKVMIMLRLPVKW
jgi:hypothetical protein